MCAYPNTQSLQPESTDTGMRRPGNHIGHGNHSMLDARVREGHSLGVLPPLFQSFPSLMQAPGHPLRRGIRLVKSLLNILNMLECS